MRSVLWLLMSIICFLFVQVTVMNAEETTPAFDQLNKLSDEALQLTKSQRYEDAKKILETFSDKFSAVTGLNESFTMDELRIVTVAHNEAVEAMTNSNMEPNERISSVTKFRLVIDAVSSTKQPLWTEMESPIMEVINEAKNAALNGDTVTFHNNLNSFLSLYDTVYPSIKLDVPLETIQKLDTRIHYIDSYRNEIITNANARQELMALEADLQAVFENLTEDEADPSLWWVIISTGSIIIITLSYVGWRKYKGEREKKKNRSRN
jgi:sporulation protein YpjB